MQWIVSLFQNFIAHKPGLNANHCQIVICMCIYEYNYMHANVREWNGSTESDFVQWRLSAMSILCSMKMKDSNIICNILINLFPLKYNTNTQRNNLKCIKYIKIVVLVVDIGHLPAISIMCETPEQYSITIIPLYWIFLESNLIRSNENKFKWENIH